MATRALSNPCFEWEQECVDNAEAEAGAAWEEACDRGVGPRGCEAAAWAAVHDMWLGEGCWRRHTELRALMQGIWDGENRSFRLD